MVRMAGEIEAHHEIAEAGSDGLVRLLSMPGYLIRRSKQLTTGAFAEVARKTSITPVQFAVLYILAERPRIDQTELAELAGLDLTTTSGVLNRLEARSLILRSETGHRRRSELTLEGKSLLEELKPQVAGAQKVVMKSLTVREQAQLLRLLSKMNGVSNQHYDTRRRKQTKP
jgi:DNA-binding MarR family transcriptional regulator